MIHEMRVYTCLTVKLPAMQERFEKETLAILDRLGIRPLGFWTTAIGPSSQDLVYFLEWQSLEERERKWAEFSADPEWKDAKARTEAAGPIIANIASSILKPTPFHRPFAQR